jgi:hypothetical protein
LYPHATDLGSVFSRRPRRRHKSGFAVEHGFETARTSTRDQEKTFLRTPRPELLDSGEKEADLSETDEMASEAVE